MKTNINILTSHQPFCLAVSGGVDSMALALMCKESELNFKTVIIDHNYRENSEKEASSAKEILKNNGIEAIIIKNLLAPPESNVEAELRSIRYNLLADFCKNNDLKAIVTAHHADDQIETFFMRLERGSTLDGLCGINEFSEFSGVKLIRPLLSFTKQELTEYVESRGTTWVEDESNQSDDFTRNKIRHTLEEFSDYNLIRKRLLNTIDSFSSLKDYVDSEVEKSLGQLIERDKNSENFVLDIEKFRMLHPEIALRCLKSLLFELSPEREVRFEKLKKLYSEIMNDDEFKRSLNFIEFHLPKASSKLYLKKLS